MDPDTRDRAYMAHIEEDMKDEMLSRHLDPKQREKFVQQWASENAVPPVLLRAPSEMSSAAAHDLSCRIEALEHENQALRAEIAALKESVEGVLLQIKSILEFLKSPVKTVREAIKRRSRSPRDMRGRVQLVEPEEGPVKDSRADGERRFFDDD